MPRVAKPKGTIRVTYELINPETVDGAPMYKLLRDYIDLYHEELSDARIALAWCTSWKPDVDGRLTIGKCKRATELDREIAAVDFIILLSRTFWQDRRVTPAQRAALIDHELCHATVKLDPRTLEPVHNDRRRIVYRTRKHDLEEFSDIVRRHGCYKRDLEQFAAALREADARAEFTPCDACRETSPGYVPVLEDGVAKVKRCACWLQWSERRREAQAA
jgi:hypothetical protein